MRDASQDQDPDQDAPARKVKRITKDPKANTVGLPDRERDELDRLERERLRKQWLAEQERIKGETIEIVYSYWDGSGHRKSVEVSLAVHSRLIAEQRPCKMKRLQADCPG